MEKKPFYLSRTLWGVVIMLIGFYSPRIASALAYNLDDIFTIIGQISTAVGAGLAIYGRVKAKQELSLTPTKE